MQPRLVAALSHLASAHRQRDGGRFIASTLTLYGAAHQRDLRDGSNTGQRLAAKAQRLKGVQVFHALYLIRRMAREGLRQLLFRYADAVVGHANEPQAATAYLHANIARA